MPYQQHHQQQYSPGLGIAPLGLVAESERNILCTLSATKPHSVIPKPVTHPRGDHGVVPVLVLGVGDAAEVDEHRDERSEVEEGRQAGEPELLQQNHYSSRRETIKKEG